MTHANTKLIRERLSSEIYRICESEEYSNYKVGSLTALDNIRYRIEVTVDDRTCHLDFHFKTTGQHRYKTTIQTGQGRNIDLQHNFVEKIMQNNDNFSENYLELNKNYEEIIGGKNKYNDQLVYKKLDGTVYDELIELLSTDEIFDSITDVVNNNTRVIKKIMGKDGIEVTLTRFINNAMGTSTIMVQGKPLLMFSACAAYISELIDQSSVVEALNDYYELDVTKDEIVCEYEGLLPNAKIYLNDKLKRCLCQALQNKRDTSQMFDCTPVVFSVFRALEGHLKYVLDDRDITVRQNFSMFDPVRNDSNRKIGGVLQSHYRGKFSVRELECINKTYTKIYLTRNQLFHWDDINPLADTTRLIERYEVEHIVNDVFRLIDEYYS